MLEVILCIVLLPAAILAGVFTLALGVGIVKYFKQKNGSKGSEKI